jgi:iron-sulfur cluster repair protein YtfE (RIC family)
MATKQLNDLSRVELSFHSSSLENLFHSAMHTFEFDREEGIRLLRQFPQSTLIDFLCQNHKLYLNKLIPEIEQQFLRIIQLEPQHSSITLNLFAIFRSFVDELKEHIEFEEKAMFPLLRTAWLGSENQNANILGHSHHQHDEEVFEILENLVAKSDQLGHLMPFRMLLEKLKVLYSELRLHAAIEDEVLL